MNLNILKETDVKLFSRKRITFQTESKGVTPSRSDLIKEVAKAAKSKPELVVIKHIYTKFGSKNIKIIAHIYNTRKDLEKIEEKYIVKKHKVEEPKKEEAAPAEEKVEEAPAKEE